MKDLRRGLLMTMLILGLAGAGDVVAETETGASGLDSLLDSVHRETLDNGLTLLVSEQPGSGVVAINTWVKAGYFHEPDEVAGMAHLFEHMFFKGSKAFPEPEQIAGELARVGGRSNAGTIYDSTNYYFVLPSEGFQRGLEIQADALINPLFDPEELAKEAEVVIEESNRKLDRPDAVSLERMWATAFTRHRMKRWRIGSNEVLRNIERDDLLAFFETLYRPENIILSIAGDVTAEEASRVAKETFGKLERGTLEKQGGPAEPPQEEFRYGQSSADLTQSYSVLGWHTPGVGHEDDVALDVLASVLGQGRSSRLYRGVVGPDGASTSNAGHYTFDDVGVFFVRSSFDEAKRQEVDRRTLVEVERLRVHGPTDYEMALARNQVESDLTFAFEDALGRARTLASWEARGGFGRIAEYVGELNALTAEQVRAAARRYLTVDNLTLYHYRPDGTPESTRESELEKVVAAVAESPSPPEEAEQPPASVALASASSSSSVQQLSLDNGMTLLVEPRPGAPIVSTGIYFAGGATAENSGNAGITQLMLGTMLRGTTTRSREEIDREIEFLGTSVDRRLDSDYFGLGLDILAKNFASGVDLVTDILLHPTFPAAELDEERHLQLAAIKRSKDSAFQRPFQLLGRELFGSHPYGLPSTGDPTSLASLDREDLEAWWRRHVVADGAVVVVGDVDPQEVRGRLNRALASLPAAPAGQMEVPDPVSPEARIETTEFRRRKQSAITVGFPTVPRSHADWPALRLLQNVTSGLAGTFFGELRGRQSLAYTVFAGQQSMAEAGFFYAYLATDADKEPAARKALMLEIERLQTDGVTVEDVERAQAYYAGSTRISLQTNDARVATHADNHFYGLGLDFTERTLEAIAALSVDDLRGVAKRYLAHDRYAVAILRGEADEE